MPHPAPGAAAPDFTLPSTAGTPVTLSSHRGRPVLLAFFPLAFTRVCTAELCAFTEDFEQFAGSGAVVLPISCDSVPALKAYQAQERIGLDLLSDMKREVSRLYGTLDEDAFISRRAYVLIDAAGVVRWVHEEAALGHRRENGELLAQIKALG